MGSRGTFVLQRLGALLSNYLKPSTFSSVNCGHVAASRSAGHATEFVNIGRTVVVASKSGPVETGPTALVATALHNVVGLNLCP